uniref:Uncharacterized protein n=1 Tax=Gouania willdenowi TaxID=441366 RepID=A0A8C5GEM5_GOUWI
MFAQNGRASHDSTNCNFNLLSFLMIHFFPLAESSTFETMTFGDTNDINHLILEEDSRYRHGLLQMLFGPLHLYNMSLLLLYRQETHLETQFNVNVMQRLFLHYLEILVQLFFSCLVLPSLAVFGEGLLLALVPEPHENTLFVKSASTSCYIKLHTESCAVHLPQDVSHASLVSQETREVDGQAGVIFGPGADLPSVLLTAFSGQEAHVPVARCVKLAMRL